MQGVGAVARKSTRFVSDSLTFTGVDLGDRARALQRRRYQDSDDDDDDSEDDDSEDEDEFDDEFRAYLVQLARRDKEEALVQAAMYRIQKAQAEGRTDVHLNKDELAAMERHRQRMEEEAERKAREKSERKKKKKEQRVAVPLTQLEPVSRKKKSSHPPRKDSLPRLPSGNNSSDAQDPSGYPPMGYFPPPAGSRPRPRSGTADPNGSSFRHDYAQRPSDRHSSDSVLRPGSSSSGGRKQADPFQFQTAGPRASSQQVTGAVARRTTPGHAETAASAARRGVAPSPMTTRSRHASQRQGSDDTSENDSQSGSEEEEDETSSDSIGSGAQILQPTRGRSSGIVVEVEPESGSRSAKSKSSRRSSPVKRKPVTTRRAKKS